MAFSPRTSRLLEAAVAHDRELGRTTPVPMDEAVGEELPRAAHFHGIGAYVHEMLRGCEEVDDQLRGQMRSLRDRNTFTHLRSIQDLRFLSQTLDGRVPWLVIKGPTLAAPIHGAAHLRGYSDLDALVPGSYLQEALEALTASGATLLDRNWTLIHRDMKGEVHLELPSGTSLDLHWHLLNQPERRSAFPIDIDTVFERSVEVDVDGASVRTLGPADNTVYVAMHTMHSGGHRLIWLKDVERLLIQDGLDLAEVAERAREWNASLVLLAALVRTEGAMGAVPTADVLRRLLPPARTWEVLARRAWTQSPAGREDGHGSIGRIFARSVRPGQRRTFANLTSRTVRHLSTRGTHDTDEGNLRHFGPDDPRSGLFPAGGEQEKLAYLNAIAQECAHTGRSAPALQADE